MKKHLSAIAGVTSFTLLWLVGEPFVQRAAGGEDDSREASPQQGRADSVTEKSALTTIREGRRTFRFDTFGDQAFWGDTLKLDQAVAGANLGGVGPGVSPSTALAVGLKVDAEALPESLKQK